MSDPRFLTVGEIAADLHVSKMTVYRLVHSGALPSVKFGRTIRVPKTEYDEFVKYDKLGEF